MKVNLRTLKDEKYELEVDDNATVETLKDLIAEKYSHDKVKILLRSH